MRAATVMVSHYSIKTLRWRMSNRLYLEQNAQLALVKFSIHHSPGGPMPRLAAISDTFRHGLNLISDLCPSGKKSSLVNMTGSHSKSLIYTVTMGRYLWL